MNHRSDGGLTNVKLYAQYSYRFLRDTIDGNLDKTNEYRCPDNI